MSSNPSRGDQLPLPPKFGNQPLLTTKELQKEAFKNMEAEIVRHLCRAFQVSIHDVIHASFSFSGENKPSMMGFDDVTDKSFPTSLTLVKPDRGKGEIFTFNRMLKNPLANKLFLEFFATTNFSSDSKPSMTIGLHPRIKSFVAITNLEMAADYLCYQVAIDVNDAKKKVGDPHTKDVELQTVVFGELTTLLQAIRRQELWIP